MSYLEDIDKQLQDYDQKEYNQEEDTPHGEQAKYLSWNDYFVKKYNSEGRRADYKNLMLSLVGEVKRHALAQHNKSSRLSCQLALHRMRTLMVATPWRCCLASCNFPCTSKDTSDVQPIRGKSWKHVEVHLGREQDRDVPY